MPQAIKSMNRARVCEKGDSEDFKDKYTNETKGFSFGIKRIMKL